MAMGALNTALSYIPLIREGVDVVMGGVNNEAAYKKQREAQSQALRQLQQRQRLNEQQLAQDSAFEREKLALESEEAERKRMNALRRAVARQRASFGASGIGSGAGSSEAVLLGLFEETDENRQERERIDNLRNRVIDENQGQQRSLNLLQESQLRQKQDLDRAAMGLTRTGNIIDTVFDATDFAGNIRTILGA